MSATTITRYASKCGHPYEAESFRGRKHLCDSCKDARGGITAGLWVRLEDGRVGQVWSEGPKAGTWFVALDGGSWVEMTDVEVLRGLTGLSAADDIDALFTTEDEPTIAVTVDTAAAVATPAPAARPGVVVESYRLVAHDVSHTERDGHVVAACGDRYATDDATRSSEYRGASLVHPMGEGAAHESVCRRCVAAARAAAEREDLATLPEPRAEGAVRGIPAPVAPKRGRKPAVGDVFTILCHDIDGTFVPSAEVVAAAVTEMNDGTFRITTARPGSDDSRSMEFYVDPTGHVLDGPADCPTCKMPTFSVDGLTFDATTGERHSCPVAPTHPDGTPESAPRVETVGVFGDADAAVRALLAPLGVHATPIGGRDSVLVLLAPGARPAAGYRCRPPRVVVGTPAQYERHDGVWTWAPMRVPTLAERAERVSAERCVVLGDAADEAWLVERVRAAAGMPADCPPNG